MVFMKKISIVSSYKKDIMVVVKYEQFYEVIVFGMQAL